MSNFEVLDLGHLSYRPCVELQREILEDVLAHRKPDQLLFVEHDPVLTLGSNFHPQNLLLTPEEYASRSIDVVKTDRGGDVTYHGPGQLVIYPIFNVANHGKDLHRWLRDLEETMLATLGAFDVAGHRFPPNTGVWINDRKVAAIGIKVRRWINMHGIALNCENDLSAFDLIVPCGIEEYGVTSLSREKGYRIGIEDVKPAVVEAFAKVFGTGHLGD